jgi:hypothetical protein
LQGLCGTILRILPLTIALILFAALPAADLCAGQRQQQIANTDSNQQSCAELQQRGPDFEPLATACRYAVSAPRTLPDFVCTEVVKRYFSPQQKPEIVAAQLTVEDTRSHYDNVTVNGKSLASGRTGDDLFEEKAGSTGEFAMLFNVFDATSRAEFVPPVDATVGSKRLQRYDYRVKRANNVNWTWFFVGTATNPGYHGSVFVDKQTGEVLRLVVRVSPDEVDPETPVSEATTTIDYGDVQVGAAGTHHVPVGGENVSCFRMMSGCIRAVIVFNNFHKFGADTRILPTRQ